MGNKSENVNDPPNKHAYIAEAVLKAMKKA